MNITILDSVRAVSESLLSMVTFDKHYIGPGPLFLDRALVLLIPHGKPEHFLTPTSNTF